MHWNMLAQKMTDQGKLGFPNIDLRWLKWEHRFKLIKAEISRSNPDVLGLTEFDSLIVNDRLEPTYNE
jgi:mRNA deadenylase 3'-5' endonuclease subunit Ccr4